MADHTETKINLPDEKASFSLGKSIASQLKAGDIVLLSGDLGAGKTTLCRSIIRSIMDNPTLDVTSPTFTLLQEYETPQGLVHHYDLYRLKGADDVLELGWTDSIQNAIVLVEWADKLEHHKPDQCKEIAIFFERGKENARRVILKNFEDVAI